MSERIADPARTHAVLVGIEKYDAGGEWNKLSGPVPDVLAFHEWLRSRNVPTGQIQTLVSPQDENVALLDQAKVERTPATSTNVRKAFSALHGMHGDLLFVFWAGHGVVHEKQHRLFLADATTNDKRNLDLDGLLESLGSSYFSGFPRQIFIVDACANYQSFAFTYPSEELPCGDPLPHEQFVFFAAQRGQVAKNLGGENRGLFSREILKQIRNLPDSIWPPDMRSLAEKVQGEFAALRASGNLDQTPTYQWNRDWDGNEIELKTPPPSSEGERRPPIETWELTFNQKSGLTDVLMNCSSMSRSESRNDVLSQIRSDVRGAVRHRPDTKSDVMNIILAASQYHGGLEELLSIIHYYEGQSLSWNKVERVVANLLPNLRTPSTESPGASS